MSDRLAFVSQPVSVWIPRNRQAVLRSFHIRQVLWVVCPLSCERALRERTQPSAAVEHSFTDPDRHSFAFFFSPPTTDRTRELRVPSVRIARLACYEEAVKSVCAALAASTTLPHPAPRSTAAACGVFRHLC